MKIRMLLSVLFLCLAATTAQAQLTLSNGAYFENSFENMAPYRAVRFTIENPYSNAVKYRVRIAAGSVEINIPAQELAAGEQRTFNIPILKGANNIYYGGTAANITVDDGSGKPIYLSVGGENSAFLNIASINSWPSESQMRAFTASAQSQLSMHSRRGGSSGTDNYVRSLEPIDLPDDWQCYAPFRVVFISESAEAELGHAASAALMDYVKMGGEMVIYNASKPMEEQILFGKVKRVAQNPIKQGTIDSAWQQSDERFKMFRNESKSSRGWFPYVTKIAGGSVGGLILATLFFIIAGPVNYLHFKRKGRIRMLMISLPVISIAFCLLITIFFVAVQGFARKGGTISMTLVDEARASALTFGRHSLFSGLYPLGGFTFDSATSFFPTSEDERSQDNSTFEVLGNTQNLTSGLFKPSVDFHYATITPSGTKEKMIYMPNDKTITNGFEASVESLVLVDDLKYFAADNVGAGKPVALREIQAADIEEAFFNTISGLTSQEEEFIKRRMTILLDPVKRAAQQGKRCYVALLSDSPDKAMAGLGEEFGESVHILAGIMAAEK